MKEVIILAGGLGTRLKDKLPDVPKCMAPVHGRPFLSYIIDSLRLQGIERFIFSLGYKSEIIERFLKSDYPTLNYINVIEKEPLGTGGAISLGLQSAIDPHVLIVNGDTLFKVNGAAMYDLHISNRSECTLALKLMEKFERYGVVEINSDKKIISFKEKKYYDKGLINGGVYLIDRKAFLKLNYPQKFSFEKDYLEAYYTDHPFYGCEQNGYFIDIGIPEDYEKVTRDLKLASPELNKINKDWTLFLDRDGVINDEIKDEYVLNPGQFKFSAGVLEAI